MAKKKETKYGIWYTPDRTLSEPGWVYEDESDRVALYASERSAKKDIKGFVNPQIYEARPYTRARRSRT